MSSDIYFGLQGKGSKCVINVNTIDYFTLRTIFKSPVKSFLLYIYIKTYLIYLIRSKIIILDNNDKSFIDSRINESDKFQFIWRGGEHCFGKDTFAFKNEKEVIIYQIPKSINSGVRLHESFKSFIEININSNFFSIPQYELSNINEKFVLISKNKNVYKFKQCYRPSDIERVLVDIQATSGRTHSDITVLFDKYEKVSQELSVTHHPVGDIVQVIDRLMLCMKKSHCGGVELVASHGDFTRWNIMQEKTSSKFLIIDWEWFDYRPIGFDLMHYIVNLSDMSNKSFDIDQSYKMLIKNLSAFESYMLLSQQNKEKYMVFYFLEIICFFSTSSFLSSNCASESDYIVIGNYAKLSNYFLEHR
ncbi:phosphotransferase [Porticoccaceae bacterium]|nr:phosphotransferase [Porticoccaceae bacterium]